ncbi:hypothetical protein VAI2_9 [Vibrio phage VAI2]|uniref:Uncharacterized protein n=1 Tax=Vibrio phage VAI1 TaxID=2601671 RepID=A0A7D0JH98_9VIRU|nr:hypothetical protein QII11_gp01 [Vibrio phage VAI1]QFG06236.1 hypothetical protein VAI2_9 [Vibrio phage VAI2]QFG06247.1 hypothetical protein VAI1_9 [Vibrio phage VAI1]
MEYEHALCELCVRASLANRFSFLACTQQAATMSKSIAHSLPRSGQRQTLNIIHNHNTHFKK